MSRRVPIFNRRPELINFGEKLRARKSQNECIYARRQQKPQRKKGLRETGCTEYSWCWPVKDDKVCPADLRSSPAQSRPHCLPYTSFIWN